jgi:hypothetical protein
VENRVTSIRASIWPQCWGHCPGRENPADIPSRGMTATELSRNRLWLSGPDWLSECQDLPDEDSDADSEFPEECCQEMKSKKTAHTLVVAQDHGPRLGQLLSCENFSSLHRLLRVTALVLKFVHLLRVRVGKPSTAAPTDLPSGIDQARLYWLRDAQSQLEQTASFLCGSTNLIYFSTNPNYGDVEAGWLIQIFPLPPETRYFWTRVTHWQYSL